MFGDSRDGAAAGMVLARLAGADRPFLWVQERMALYEAGVPSLLGLTGWNAPADLVRVRVRNATELLWTMEEGLGCKGLSAVVGEVWGTPPALDFTATKRLILRAEASGVPAYLIRLAAQPMLSAAHERWRVQALPSEAHPYDRRAPGAPRWAVDLFRARWRRPGQWEARYDRAAHRLHLASPVSDGAVEAAVRRTGVQ